MKSIFAILNDDQRYKERFQIWFLVLTVAFSLAVWFSEGFHHFDEHFQVLEFISLKWGIATRGDLAEEFHLSMRPWAQPAILYGLTKILSFIGIDGPHAWAVGMRFLSGLWGLIAVFMMGLWPIRYLSRKNQNIYLAPILIFSCWFLPYYFVRPSSDSWGTTFFIAGLILLLFQFPLDFFKDGGRSLTFSLSSKGRLSLSIPSCLAVGLLMAGSFHFRYQLGLAIFAVYLWALIYGKVSYKSGFWLTLSLFIGLGIGVVIDKWGYGKWEFAAWNYIYVDILRHVKQNLLPTPWHYYFSKGFMKGIPPLSLAYFAIPMFFWWKYRKHPLTFATLPFFVAHCLIGHKELRFILPVFSLIPLMFVVILSDEKNSSLIDSFKVKKSVANTLKFLFAINLIMLPLGSIKKPKRAVAFYRFLDKNEINDIHYMVYNPFTMVGRPLKYYYPKGLKLTELKNWDELKAIKTEINLMTTKGHQYFYMKKNMPNCKAVHFTYPEWILKYNIGNWISRSRVWALFKCNAP